MEVLYSILNNYYEFNKKYLLFRFSVDQSFIGSVVIQSFVDDDDDSSDEDDANPEFDSAGMIFGITSAVNISKNFSSGCIDGLRGYLLTKCDQFAAPNDLVLFKNALNDYSNRAGFLINERFVNIPPQISVPLLENLNKEVNRAAVKSDKFSFTHYVMLVKFHRKDAKKSKDKAIEELYSNGEEEILCEQCDASFEYSVQSEADSALSGHWLEGDSSLIPHRKVVLFESHKLLPIIESIKNAINEWI